MLAQRRPFFAFLNYYDTHAPYLPPRGFEGRFGPKSVTAAARETLRTWEPGERIQHSPADIKLARDRYDECIAYLDDQIGRLFGELDTKGLLANTVVVITADHGEHFGEHAGVFGHMYTLYGQEIRVPLLVIAPGRVPAGRAFSRPQASESCLPPSPTWQVSVARFPSRAVRSRGSGPRGRRRR